MPREPKGERRPTDVLGNAVHVMRIAKSEVQDIEPDNGKDKAAQGRKGGAARAKGMAAKQRSEIARKAAAARWGSKH